MTIYFEKDIKENMQNYFHLQSVKIEIENNNYDISDLFDLGFEFREDKEAIDYISITIKDMIVLDE